MRATFDINLEDSVASLGQATVFALGGALLVRYVNGAWPWADEAREKRWYIGVPILFALSWLALVLMDR